jgi:hypothetical protein
MSKKLRIYPNRVIFSMVSEKSASTMFFILFLYLCTVYTVIVVSKRKMMFLTNTDFQMLRINFISQDILFFTAINILLHAYQVNVILCYT